MIEDTIRDLFSKGDIDGIIYQLGILMEDRNRVRAENDGFKHEIRRLAQAFAAITEPATGRPVSEGTTKKTLNPGPTTARPSAPRPQTPPKPTKPSKEALDLDL